MGELTTQVKDELERLLNQHPTEAQSIVELAVERAQARVKASKSVKRKKPTSGPALPGKLADCIDSNFEKAELYLVEGDSAGGSAKQARDKKHQAIMPLRGKIQNTWEVETENLFSSKEVSDIATAIGMDPGSDDLTGLRYNRVCILADADVDGYHIATLLNALFYRHFRPLVENGHLYIAVPPLFRVDQGKDVYYAATEEEKDELVAKLESKKGNIAVQRFKGLGEMNPEQLEQTVMSANSRSLLQVRVEDSQQAVEHLSMLLGKKNAHKRRAWMETYGDKADLET